MTNSPEKVICRLLKTDYFKIMPRKDYELWNPRIQKHKAICNLHKVKEDSVEKIKGFLGMYEETMNEIIDFSKLMGTPLNTVESKKILRQGLDQVKTELDKVVITKDKEKLKKLNDVRKIMSMVGM